MDDVVLIDGYEEKRESATDIETNLLISLWALRLCGLHLVPGLGQDPPDPRAQRC